MNHRATTPEDLFRTVLRGNKFGLDLTICTSSLTLTEFS